MKNNRKIVITLLLAFVVALVSVCVGSSASCLAAKKKQHIKKQLRHIRNLLVKK